MSEILQGVLRMPPSCWDNGALDQMQRHRRYVEAANLIEVLQAENKELKLKLAERLDQLVKMSGENERLIHIISNNEGSTLLKEENTRLSELLSTERMSADKTLEHNNRLINEVDRLREELEWLLEEVVDESDFWIDNTRWERIEEIRALLKDNPKNEPR